MSEQRPLRPLDGGYGSDFEPEPEPVESAWLVETIEEFAALDEPGARSLLGEDGQALLAENSDAMIYGDGGAGKTTLCIDLACHLAAGKSWLGIEISEPRRVLIIEDEGPRAFFRKKLAAKLAAFGDPSIASRIFVLAEPWARFTFLDEGHRASLAAEIAVLEIDVVIVGPVVVAGMNKAGTLQEVREFLALVHDVRARCGQIVTFLLIHHENKGGTVSGAWEGAGDTLLHLATSGPRASRLTIQKARQAPRYHLEVLKLNWLMDGEGFELGETPKVDDEELEQRILDALRKEPGLSWGQLRKLATGNPERLASVRDQLFQRGLVVNVAFEDGQDVALAYIDGKKRSRLFLAVHVAVADLLPARLPV